MVNTSEVQEIKMGNIHTFLENPFPLKKIPKVPKYEMLIAKGGELTYDISDDCTFAGPMAVIPYAREAEPGEILRGKSLKYRVDVTKNLLYRGQVKLECENNKYMQELQMGYCASDINYFINTFCWTFTPGEKPVPFILYPFQEDMTTWMLWLIFYELSGAIEKSRDMGLSWTTVAALAWMILFYDMYIGYLFSMTEAEVDNKTEDSLFGKLRFLLENLPEWMKGGWKRNGKDSEGSVIDKLLETKIPKTNSRITGKLTGGQSGRSGRAKVCFYDEFAFIDNAAQVQSSAATLAPCEIYGSTVCGMNNEFARITHRDGCLKKAYHWTDHPLKNEKWAILERSKSKYTEERWNQEHEIDYTGSTTGRVYPRFTTYVIHSDHEPRWCHIQDGIYYEFDPAYDVYVGLDFGISDPNAVIYFQEKPTPPQFAELNPYKSTFIAFDEDVNRDQTDDELAEMIKRKRKDLGYRCIKYIGDLRTANRRDFGGIMLKTKLSKHGIHIIGKWNTEDAPIKAVRRRLAYPGAIAFLRKGVPFAIEAVQNWSFPVDKNTNQPKAGSKPLHDKYSHINKAIAYTFDWIDMGERTEKIRPTSDIDWDYDPVSSFSI